MKRTVLILILLTAACGIRCAADLDSNVVATVGDEALLRTELELYFQVNLLDQAEPAYEPTDPDARELDRVKSRLLDAFVKERTLFAEARRRRIEVSDQEIEDYLDLARFEGHGIDELALESRRSLARTSLAVQKLQERIAGQIAAPTEEEVASFAEQAEGLPGTGKRILVRVLHFESAETAQQVHSDIRRRRTTFADAAPAHETQPGQAAPQTLDWESLPEQIRDALEDLKPGQVSVPLDYNGLNYLFQVQAWLEDGGWSERERLRVAREELERRKRAEACEILLRELREANEVQLQTAHLGFQYIPEAES